MSTTLTVVSASFDLPPAPSLLLLLLLFPFQSGCAHANRSVLSRKGYENVVFLLFFLCSLMIVAAE